MKCRASHVGTSWKCLHHIIYFWTCDQNKNKNKTTFFNFFLHIKKVYAWHVVIHGNERRISSKGWWSWGSRNSGTHLTIWFDFDWSIWQLVVVSYVGDYLQFWATCIWPKTKNKPNYVQLDPSSSSTYNLSPLKQCMPDATYAYQFNSISPPSIHPKYSNNNSKLICPSNLAHNLFYNEPWLLAFNVNTFWKW